MSILFLLIPLAVVMVTIFVGLLFWATRNGQFDDLDSPAMRPVLDDDRAPRQPVRLVSQSGQAPDA